VSDTYYDVENCADCGEEFSEGDEVIYIGGETADDLLRIRIEDPVFLCSECYERAVSDSAIRAEIAILQDALAKRDETLQKIADFYKTPGLEKAQNAMAYDMRRMALEALGKDEN